ncbi:MAG: hypothetical protein COS42_10975 [Flavobacteriales bacterium CG03_land_8_20_14_0_80_35_15]|nr:hypothetical protein [Zetaproteobacteria bacterium]OIO12077.1 MAG: hypothetical protein AUJ53_03215 [Flavobacteriaceae bacterium CG1_02_35_72]PIV16250.1 MAG: hypothetical protein COS42_10975 [Flavobacteriales bacterium CG03_land_8_20_14_0_80_35_15]PJA04659.1 MAG: hypothetical protein COX71_10665 [Flavobacteriales bacterium CG_4_10_14_0_2_um_filter_35_18]
MKLIIFLFITNSLFASVLDDIRNQFPQIKSLKEADLYLNLLEKENNAESKAYFGAMLLMKSRYAKFPLTKYSYFKKGKLVLDNCIKNYKMNLEMRYLRFVFQNQIPDFLNYHANIDEDFSVIVKGIEKADLNKDFKIKILNNMLIVKKLTPNQGTQIKLLLAKI